MGGTKGHGAKPVDLYTATLHIVQAEICMLVMAWMSWHLTVCVIKIVSFSQEAAVTIGSLARLKIATHQRAKGVNHVQVTTVVHAADAEIIYQAHLGLFFSVQRRMASARSFNMFPSMLHMRLIN